MQCKISFCRARLQSPPGLVYYSLHLTPPVPSLRQSVAWTPIVLTNTLLPRYPTCQLI